MLAGKPPRVVVAAGPEELAKAARPLVLEAERSAIARSGLFRIALAGGRTPQRLYELLAESDEARFASWHVFFGDERWVPAGHRDSNARMAREALFDRVAIPPHQIHAIDTRAGTPVKAANLYAIQITRSVPAEYGTLPSFDLVLLGLGADGHTASLFPGSTALAAPPTAIAVSNWVPSQHTWRVTLTTAVINAAHSVMFLVSGADKADALSRVLEGTGDDLPAAGVQPRSGDCCFVVDEAAAASLSPSWRSEA